MKQNFINDPDKAGKVSYKFVGEAETFEYHYAANDTEAEQIRVENGYDSFSVATILKTVG